MMMQISDYGQIQLFLFFCQENAIKLFVKIVNSVNEVEILEL